MNKRGGDFTLPGEAGQEAWAMELADRWGADAIRDSDGTSLSPALMEQGMTVYSTVCIIRSHNDFIRKHPRTRQQTFLCTAPKVHTGGPLRFVVMDDFFSGQFEVNGGEDSLPFWQVTDRTANLEVPAENWEYLKEEGAVLLKEASPFHAYTVSFLAYRVWEEISMYNHTANRWDSEPLMQLDPSWPEARAYLLDWMEKWLLEHPATGIVRFTSLFYNFVWIWGSDTRRRSLFTDWASYDFTVSPPLLQAFKEHFGYALRAEDFVNKGLYRSTHSVPDRKKRDWMAFVQDQVLDLGRELVALVHRYGKKAYVFYDDSWVGLEPYGERFPEYGFDGIIKCAFSGFEARLCAGVPAPVKELRLHPYLFPVGLGGSPTFSPGGDPAGDARAYWMNIRRALLRQGLDRIGLGGYLSLTRGYPEFVAYIGQLAEEFRRIKALHAQGTPAVKKPRVAVLHAWGRLRSWTLSGHFHENDTHDLMHLLEALSGLPLSVRFLDFEDLEEGALQDADLLLVAGARNSAWSGGSLWTDKAVERVQAWAFGGGTLLGVGHPAALEGYNTLLRLSQVLGVDVDDGRYASHGPWRFEADCPPELMAEGAFVPALPGVRLTDGTTQVLLAKDGLPLLTRHAFGKGQGIYLSGFRYSPGNARLLLRLILPASKDGEETFIPTDPQVDCAWFPAGRALALANAGGLPQHGKVPLEEGTLEYELEPYELKILRL